ncbi:tail fiber domain-containing protein [Candidatus Wolfebacteria bacterium]|nr:tail fiber domain-containing protein [Candidatus Wolfebacteria bacterium]
MTDGIEFNGKTYISSRRAAEISGYTSDYIGQLARAGKIRSKLIGKLRFVDEESTRAYVAEHASNRETETQPLTTREDFSPPPRKPFSRSESTIEPRGTGSNEDFPYLRRVRILSSQSSRNKRVTRGALRVAVSLLIAGLVISGYMFRHTLDVSVATYDVRNMIGSAWSGLSTFVDDGLNGSERTIRRLGERLPNVGVANVWSIFDPVRVFARSLYYTLCPIVPRGAGCRDENTALVIDEDVVEEAKERMAQQEEFIPSPQSQGMSPWVVERIIERIPVVVSNVSDSLSLLDVETAVNALRDELTPRIDRAARSPSNRSGAGDFLPTSGGTLTGALSGTDGTFSGELSSDTLTVSASTTLNGVEYLFPGSDGTSGQALTTNGVGGLSWAAVSGDESWEFFNESGVRLATTTNQVLIGASATTTNQKLEVIGGGYFSGNLGIGTTSPASPLDVWGDVRVGTSSTPLLFADVSTGRVGIGIENPTQQLSISGNFGLPQTTATEGIVYMGLNRYLHSFGNITNLFLGRDAGNFTMSGTLGNIGIGYQTLQSLTSGQSNVALGVTAGKFLTTGIDNTALGDTSLFNVSTGDENTAVGAQALTGTNSGSFNTGVGFLAGNTNVDGTYNTLVGYNADVLNTGFTNATAIGKNAKVGASNSLVLGGTGADAVNVGIGTTSPFARLSVSGNLALTGGVYDNSASLGTNGSVLQTTGSGIQWVATSTLGLTTSPGGADTYVQYNNGGSFGGDANFVWNDNNATLNLSASSTAQLLLPLSNDATTPTLAFGDGDTGFFEILDNHLAVAIGGNSVLTIDSSDISNAGDYRMTAFGNYIGVLGGNRFEVNNGSIPVFSSTNAEVARFTDSTFGIGTTSPWARLSVTNTGTAPSFVVEDATSSDSTPFIIDASGNVGIGIASPTAKLHVVIPSSESQTALKVTQSNSTEAVATLLSSGGKGLTIDRFGAAILSEGLTVQAAGVTLLTATGNSPGLLVEPRLSSDVVLGVRGKSGQSVNLQEWQNNSGTVLSVVDASGNVGVGTSSPWRTLSASGTVAFSGLTLNTGAAAASLCLSSAGEVTRNTDAETCLASSERYKHDIETLPENFALSRVVQLRPVSFEYNAVPGTRYGLIAEEVDSVDEQLVGYDGEGRPNSVRYISIVPLLIQAIQELVERVDQLAAAIGSGITNTVNLVVERLTVGSSEKPSGITLYDERTGEPYCLSVRGGTTITRSGECGKVSDSEASAGETSASESQDTPSGGGGEAEEPQGGKGTTTPEIEDGDGGEDGGEIGKSIGGTDGAVEESEEPAGEPEASEPEPIGTSEPETSEEALPHSDESAPAPQQEDSEADTEPDTESTDTP